MDSDVCEGDQKAPIGLPQNHTCIHRCVNEGTSKRGQETKLGTYKPNNCLISVPRSMELRPFSLELLCLTKVAPRNSPCAALPLHYTN